MLLGSIELGVDWMSSKVEPAVTATLDGIVHDLFASLIVHEALGDPLS